MEHTRLVARLLNEVAAARAAITASYARLWRSDAGSPADPSDLETGPEPRKPDVGSLGDARSRDVG
jgi:hypothetical protein